VRLDDNGVWQPKEFEGNYVIAYSGTTTSLSQTGWNPSQSGNIWDGNTSTRATGYNGGVVGTVTFNPPLTGVTKVEVYVQDYNHFLNGSAITTSESSTGWHTYYNNSGSPITLNSLGNAYSSNTQTVDIYAIRINDTLVNAQTWTPPSGVGFASSGANSFHLDFADNSSNAALGTDTSGVSPANTWTVNNLNASVDSFGSVEFDGSTTRYVRHNSISVSSTWTLEMHFKPNNSSVVGLFDTASGSSGAFRNYAANNIQTTNGDSQSIAGAYNVGQWNHFAVVRQAAGNDRVYINGTLVGSQRNFSGLVFNQLDIGTINGGGDGKFNGYIRNVRWSNNARYTANYTAPPVATDLTSDSNTQILMMAGSLGGNSTTGSPVYSVPSSAGIDSLVDTPTNGTQTDTGAGGEVVGNYATLNPLQSNATGPLANGNLEWGGTNAGNFQSSVATIGMSSGKWYAEFTLYGGSTDTTCGIARLSNSYELVTTGWFVGGTATSYGYYASVGNKINSGAGSSYGATYADGDTIGVAFDADNGTLTFYKNGVSQGTAFTGLTGTFAFACSAYATNKWIANFGQRAFAYPLSGYKSLCTSNLPEPTIADGSKYFDTKLYDGTGSTQALTMANSELSPDFVWIKNRNSTGHNSLFDSVRGATKILYSNLTNAENTIASSLSAFNNNGFTVVSDNDVNGSTRNYVAWAWAAGDLATTSDTTNYNQSQAWSSNITTTGYSGNWWPANPKTYIFDADTTNYGHANANGGAVTVTLTVNPTITSTSSVTIYGGMQGSGTATVSINGGTAVALTSGSSATTETVVSFSGAVSSIVITKTSSDAQGLLIYGFKIDGKRLLDPGIIPAGSLNSSAYNQTDWSGNTTATNIATNVGNDLASVFDGNLANGTRAANNGGTGTLQWSSGTIQGNVRVYTGLAGTQGLTYYNGSTSNTIASVNNGWNDLGNIDLTRLDFVYSGGNITFINAIELDGKLLINNSVTPTNVPSIASTVRANPSAGFSIVTYTGNATSGSTVGHGLNATPKMVIYKNRNDASDWRVYNTMADGSLDILYLNTTAAKTDSGLATFTNSVFTVGSSNDTNGSGDSLLAYCFAPVEGYSAMGSYEGNGSADGPFIYTGFKVAWLMTKNIDNYGSGYDWHIYDNERNLSNVCKQRLNANLSNAEDTYDAVDFVSNGFKLRNLGGSINQNAHTHIYLAFASNPFKTARAR
jgi:hypothetical protein